MEINLEHCFLPKKEVQALYYIKHGENKLYLKTCIKFHMVSEKDTTLLRNVHDILGIKVVVAAVVLFHFVVDSFAKLECVIT